MEIKKSVSSIVETQKNRPIVFILSIVLLVGLVASALYLSFAKTAIQEQQKQLDDQIATLNTQISQLKAENVEGQQYAQQWLAELEKTEIRWSKVIKTVQDLLPTDPLTQKPRVLFLSYSGSAGGKLTLNSQTSPGTADAFGDVSTLLNVFNNSAFFKDAYIPSVSHAISQTGEDLLTFVFNVTYDEQLPGVQPLGNDQSPDSGSTQQSTSVTVAPASAPTPAPSTTTAAPAATPTPAPATAPADSVKVPR